MLRIFFGIALVIGIVVVFLLDSFYGLAEVANYRREDKLVKEDLLEEEWARRYQEKEKP